MDSAHSRDLHPPDGLLRRGMAPALYHHLYSDFGWANGHFNPVGQLVQPHDLGGLTPPGAGDIAVINNDVTVTTDTTIGDGSNSTVLNVTNGTLTITGATLTIRGNSTFGKYNNDITVTRLTVQNSGNTPGGIIFDGNIGVAPVMSVGNDTQISFIGTSSAHCVVQTLAGTAGNHGRIVNGGVMRSFFLYASYTDFSRLGDASNPGLVAGYTNVSANLANPPFTMDHCTVDHCGVLPVVSIGDGSVNVELTNSTWTNGLDPDLAMNI